MDQAQPKIAYSTYRKYIPGSSKRIWELDFLRGCCVILMVLDHLAILISTMFAYQWYGYNFYALGLGDSFTRFCCWWVDSTDRTIVHNIVLVIFFSISGISCYFSRSNFKRGCQLLAVAGAYSLVTIFMEYVLGITGEIVVFGVLDFLACAILIYTLVDAICRHDSRITSIWAAGIISITLLLYFGYTPPADTPKIFAIVFPPHDIFGNPSLFYRQSDFSPGDLFTLIPYLAYFFLGVMLAPYLYGNRRSLLPRLDGKWNIPFSFIGKHALLIYLVHIVISAGVCSFIGYLVFGTWGF